MKRWIFLLTASVVLSSCGGEREIRIDGGAKREGGKMINPYLDYQAFPTNGSASDWVGRKVTFKGYFAKEINQHLIRPAGEWKESFYVDPDPEYSGLPQMVAYRSKTVPLDPAMFEGYHLRFYGAFGVLEGGSKKPGKAGDDWREVYFDLVDIEGLWSDPKPVSR